MEKCFKFAVRATEASATAATNARREVVVASVARRIVSISRALKAVSITGIVSAGTVNGCEKA